MSLPKGKIWRKRDEGLSLNCNAKGLHAGTGGESSTRDCGYQSRSLREPYTHINGIFFSSFIRCNFKRLFQKSGKSSKLFLQDGDPSQNTEALNVRFSAM